MIDKAKGYVPSLTMRELIRDNSLLLMTVSRFGIPFGFGDDTIDKVCRDNGVDLDTFLTVCNLLSGYQYDAESIALDSLTGYLTRAHESFLRVMLPKIRRNIIEAIAGSKSDEVALLLIRFFDDYVEEVRKHMDHENNVIFRYAEGLLRGERTADFSIAQYSDSHDHTVAKLNELKDIFIYHFKQEENIRLSTALFDIITCEKDMMSHFEVENKLFIPEVERLEHCGEAQPTQVSKLSDREIDIVREVAHGKSNKEIADALFISAHTVATHRRNIAAKLDIHSSAALTLFALLHGIINPHEIKHNRD